MSRAVGVIGAAIIALWACWVSILAAGAVGIVYLIWKAALWLGGTA